MAILVKNIKIGIHQKENVAFEKALKAAEISQNHVKEIKIYKKSLDARKQKQMMFVFSILIDTDLDEKALCKRIQNPNIAYKEEIPLTFHRGTQKLNSPIVIAGFGPAGIFCAYTLAQMGYRPVVIERGYDVDKRVDAVNRFWKEGALNPECNVQFGEGGAGTFSDGKLTTRISDPRCDYILKLLVKFGAPNEILTQAKPHIGTDRLRHVIRNMRLEIERLGGTVLFGHRLENVFIDHHQLSSIVVNGEKIKTKNLVLAIGHSARDTFSMLLKQNVFIEPKSFSVGVRIEHLQSQINRGLYGAFSDDDKLPPGEYQLSYRENDRGVYTFCMCPGGLVVPSSSSEGTVVTNGMSEYLRNRKNANSAVVVSVAPSDFGTHPLDGVAFQKMLEQKAYQMAGSNYKAPAATVGDFLQRKKGLHLDTVYPSYALGVVPCDFYSLFPSFITDMLQKGFYKFNQKIPGFSNADAVMTGVETRTSSPVRITRNEDFQSISISGLYPCGEGAGYAGGIMSAAADGIKVAEKIISTYTNE